MQNINTFFSTFQQIHVYLYIYMAIDLKVFVKSLNCEDRSCSVGNPRDFFLEFAKVLLCAKVEYYESLLYTYTNTHTYSSYSYVCNISIYLSN